MTCTWRRRPRRRGPPAAAAREPPPTAAFASRSAPAGAFKDEPGLHAPRGGGVTIGSLGTSAAPRVLPGVMTHRARDDASAPSARAVCPPSRGERAMARADDGAADPRRDFPAGDVARGAALLRRMPGPEDCYRAAGGWARDAAAAIGELGFPNRDDGRGDVPERGDVPVAEGGRRRRRVQRRRRRRRRSRSGAESWAPLVVRYAREATKTESRAAAASSAGGGENTEAGAAATAPAERGGV